MNGELAVHLFLEDKQHIYSVEITLEQIIFKTITPRNEHCHR
jgi:hypothetical protein